jgi:hypothetical protein
VTLITGHQAILKAENPASARQTTLRYVDVVPRNKLFFMNISLTCCVMPAQDTE